jgi:hypothetical protein
MNQSVQPISQLSWSYSNTSLGIQQLPTADEQAFTKARRLAK